jgi:transcriptional regulator with XRE-family HTH domain
MAYRLDYSTANSNQIEKDLCEQVQKIRLARNISQAQLAEKAGVSLRTVRRLESGERVSLDTFIRVLSALGLVQNLRMIFPDLSIRPIERIALGNERQRARPPKDELKSDEWTWGE